MTSLAALAPRSDFPLLVANPTMHYLDSAATSQKPRAVLNALTRFYERSNANPHRGAYALSAAATDAYHAARVTVARFLGAADADCLIFTRGTTESMNLVASSWGRANVATGDELVGQVVVALSTATVGLVFDDALPEAGGLTETDGPGNDAVKLLARPIDVRGAGGNHWELIRIEETFQIHISCGA